MFKPGQSGNPKGRRRGAKSSRTEDLRQKISRFVTQNFDQIQEDFESLPPDKRLTYYVKILPYALPSLTAIDLTTQLKTQLEAMSEDQLKQLSEQILSSHEN